MGGTGPALRAARRPAEPLEREAPRSQELLRGAAGEQVGERIGQQRDGIVGPLRRDIVQLGAVALEVVELEVVLGTADDEGEAAAGDRDRLVVRDPAWPRVDGDRDPPLLVLERPAADDQLAMDVRLAAQDRRERAACDVGSTGAGTAVVVVAPGPAWPVTA